jgi:hypothetical protein
MDKYKPEGILQRLKNNPKLLWGIVIVGILVLALGIFFIKTSGGFELPQGSNKEPQSMGAALEESATRFTALRGRLEKEEVSEDIIKELEDIRSDLAAASKDAGAEEKELWRTLDKNLEEVGQVLQATLEENKRRQEEE